MQACLNAATSGPSIVHMISGLISIDRPCSAYSGKTTRSMVPMLRRALAVISTMRAVWAARSSGVSTTGSLSCTSPITTPFGDLFKPPSPFIAASPYLVMLNSPGAPVMARVGEEVAIKTPRVST